MTAVWNKIESLANHIEQRFDDTGIEVEQPDEYSWYNSIYSSNRYRRAHIEIVDFRESHKIYILHCTIFPHINNPAPIWGFDAVCGPNKITGAFHDFSPSGNCDPMEDWFANRVNGITWNKPRELPQWAKMIFSPSMVAAGNVQDGEELDGLITLAKETLDFYLDNIGIHNNQDMDLRNFHNNYCRWQRENPHVIKSMVAMGVNEDKMHQFVEEVLFPYIV
jgi:hypothetical protein